MFALALGDAVVKGVSASFTLWQIFAVRSAIVVAVLMILLRFGPYPALIRPKHLGWTVLRSALLAVMWVSYYAALPRVDLSMAAAAYYTSPLFITIFAAVFLGDAIARLGWLALGLGFIGVLLVLQPRVSGFNGFALLPILSAILYALAMILTRSHCKSESVVVLSLWMNIAMFLTGGVCHIRVAFVFPFAGGTL